jgi:hypothetical protein
MKKRPNREFSPYEGKSIPQERESLTNLWCHRPRREETDDNDNDDEFEYLMDEDLSLGKKVIKFVRWKNPRRAEFLEFFRLLLLHVACCSSWMMRQMHPTRVLKAAGLGREMYCVSQCQLESLLLHHLHWFYTWSIQIPFCKCFLLDYYFEAELAKENPLTVFLQSTLPSGPSSTPISAIKCFRY